MIRSKLSPHKHLVKIKELLDKLDELYLYLQDDTNPEDMHAMKLNWEAHVAVVMESQTQKNMGL